MSESKLSGSIAGMSTRERELALWATALSSGSAPATVRLAADEEDSGLKTETLLGVGGQQNQFVFSAAGVVPASAVSELRVSLPRAKVQELLRCCGTLVLCSDGWWCACVCATSEVTRHILNFFPRMSGSDLNQEAEVVSLARAATHF